MASTVKRAEVAASREPKSTEPKELVQREEAFLMVVDLTTEKVTHVSDSVETALAFTRAEVEGKHLSELLRNDENTKKLLSEVHQYSQDEPWTGKSSVKMVHSVQMLVGQSAGMHPKMRKFYEAIVRCGEQRYAPVQLYGHIQFFTKSKYEGLDAGTTCFDEVYSFQTGHPFLVVVVYRLEPAQKALKSSKDSKSVFMGKLYSTGHVVPGAIDVMHTLLGHHPTDLIKWGPSLYDLVHPDDVNWVMRQFQKASSDGTVQRTVFRMMHKEGHYLCVDAETQPFQEEKHARNVLHLYINLTFVNRRLRTVDIPLITPEVDVPVHRQAPCPTMETHLHVPSPKLKTDKADANIQHFQPEQFSKPPIEREQAFTLSFTFQLTEDGNVQNMSGDLEEITGRSSVADGTFIIPLIHKYDQIKVKESIYPVCKGTIPRMVVPVRFLKEDGTSDFVELHAEGIRNHDGDIEGCNCKCDLLSDLTKYPHLDPDSHFGDGCYGEDTWACCSYSDDSKSDEEDDKPEEFFCKLCRDIMEEELESGHEVRATTSKCAELANKEPSPMDVYMVAPTRIQRVPLRPVAQPPKKELTLLEKLFKDNKQ